MSKRDDARKLPVLISQGEPSGIGPEIALKALARLRGEIAGHPIHLVGSAGHFRDAASRLAIVFAQLESHIIDAGPTINPEPGKPSPRNASSVTLAIERCVVACMSGKAAAMVTAPIQKSTLTEAGFAFPGHTEYLAELTGARQAVMMLASASVNPPIRVVPLTIHIALKDMFRQLNAEAIVATGRVVLSALMRDFGIVGPRLAVAGMNPHAGEDGTMGREEIEIIAPAIQTLRKEKHQVIGPLSADSMFHDDARRRYDAALCMYHDQALIPIKTLDFWRGVNVTLGLPIIRTSPDHGTALEIAGKGVANEASMVAAIEMATEIADRRGL